MRAVDVTSSANAGAASDGRALRSERTRARLVDAVMAEVRDGRAPTPDSVAARAGVSPRTLFRLFGDVAGLWAAVRIKMAGDLGRLLPAGPVEGNLEARVRELVRRRIAVFDRIAPYRRWVDAHESLYPDIRRGREGLDHVLRAQTVAAIGRELRADAHEIAPVVDSLLSYESWNYLRDRRGLGSRKVAVLLERAVLRLMARGDPG